MRSPYAWGGTAFALIRLGTAHWTPTTPGQDTSGYKAIVALDVWDGDFYTGPKPWLTPLLWKVLQEDHVRIAGQLGISIAAWLVLAWTVARLIRTRTAALAGFASVLCFALTVQVTLWDSLLLSDSLSLSLFALVLAAWLLVAEAPTWRRVGLAAGLGFALAMTRDTNAYLLAMSVPAMLAWLVVSRRRALPVFAIAATAATFVLATALGGVAHRNEIALIHVFGNRLMKDPAAARYLEDHGMPSWPELSRARRITEIDRLYTAEPCVEYCAAYKSWLREDGTSVYISYLLSHPNYAFVRPIKNVHSWLAPDLKYGAYISFGRVALPDPLPAVLFAPHATQVFFWAVLVGLAMLAVALALRRQLRTLWAVPVWLMVVAVPHGMFVWLADTNLDVGRHGLLAALHARLGILLLAVFLVDAVLDRDGARAA